MNKIKIDVPTYVKYISDWVDYEIPLGKCIIDKGVTGCGFTEYCLTNKDNIILCSPRRLLLQNKIEQHPGDTNILYLRNDLESIAEYDSSEKDKLDRTKVSQNYTEIQEQFKNKMHQHIVNCTTSGKPIKFLVTYDSFKYVKQYLGPQISNFKIVIDEFQSIFTDSSFKASTELEFSGYIEDCPNVCYLSATPMLEGYLDKLDDYKDLDMYVFVWSNYIEKAHIDRTLVSSSYQAVKGVIQDYLSGKFPQIVDGNKNIFISHEAVIYLNSVTDIIKLSKSMGLTPQDTDIICADTDKNRKKLKKIGFTVSKPHTYENRHLNKMFTFCTRTVYLGADFYSDNAASYVISNPNKENLAVDIILDLPQILGRQRMMENPWKNRCTLFYQLPKELRDINSINKILDDKIKSTGYLLDTYNAVNEGTKNALFAKYQDSANYRHDYVGISRLNNVPVFNNLVWVSETRFWQVTQQEYYDNINVRRTLEGAGFVDNYIKKDKENLEIERLGTKLKSFSGCFEDKMRAYCDFCDSHGKEQKDYLDHIIGDPRFSNYYTYFGTLGVKAHSYREAPMRDILKNINGRNSGDIRDAVYSEFKEGSNYTLKYIKEKVGEIYRSLGLTITPKASHLEEYFEIKRIQEMRNGKKENCYKLISKK